MHWAAIQSYLSLFQPLFTLWATILLVFFGIAGFLKNSKSDPLTRSVITIIANFILLYLLEFGAYLISTDSLWAVFIFLLISLAAALYGHKYKSAASKIFSTPALLCWLGLATWILAMQSGIVVYGGGFWFGDWFFHYQRSLLFLYNMPSSTTILGFTLPGWGPFFNACAGFFLALFGSQFWIYQIAATALNTFLVLPLALLIRDAAGVRQSTALLIAAVLLAISPYAVQMETYTWTKSFTTALILAAIYFYRKAYSENSNFLFVCSFLTFSAATLCHYLAFPFAMFFAIHFVYRAAKEKQKWSAVALSSVCSAILMLTWFGYAFSQFGVAPVFTGTTSFGSYYEQIHKAQGTSLPAWREVFAANLISTTVPYSFRHRFPLMARATPIQQVDPRIPPEYRTEDAVRRQQVERFHRRFNNLSSIPGALGISGLVALFIAGVLAYRARKKSSSETPASTGNVFWILFFAMGIPLNIFFSRDYSPPGVAHLNLQAFVLLAWIFIVRWLKDQSILLKISLGCLFLIECVTGTRAVLALWMRRVPMIVENGGRIAIREKFEADPLYVNNYLLKLRANAEFLHDRLAALTVPFAACALFATVILLYAAYRTREEV